MTPRQFALRALSLEHMLEHFRTWFGPVKVALAALDTDGQQALGADLMAVWAKYNRARDGTVVAPSDYVEVVAVRA